MLSRHFERHLAGSSPGDIAHELRQQTNSGTKVLDFLPSHIYWRQQTITLYLISY